MAEQSNASKTVKFCLREDGIVHGIALPERMQSLDDARENLEIVTRLSGGRRVPLLLDIRTTGTLSRQAREHYAGDHGASAITCLAFLANSAFTRIVGNFFIRMAKSRYPVRLFQKEESAIQWLGNIES
jgi:hypothetical protein